MPAGELESTEADAEPEIPEPPVAARSLLQRGAQGRFRSRGIARGEIGFRKAQGRLRALRVEGAEILELLRRFPRLLAGEEQ